MHHSTKFLHISTDVFDSACTLLYFNSVCVGIFNILEVRVTPVYVEYVCISAVS